MQVERKIYLLEAQCSGGNKCGVDDDGMLWQQFEVDITIGEVPGVCDICGQDWYVGWVRLDDALADLWEVCDEHVEFTAWANLTAGADAPDWASAELEEDNP
ncbi:MAG: hypothetical protein JRI59_09340 [Deltaproteobacteria bacterium]|nr:hypothetical protein [Deltaproteobacteria bacterium]